MEKKIIEIDMDYLTGKKNAADAGYRDNLAREAQRVPKRVPTPEIKPAPRRDVRIHSRPKEKGKVRPAWIMALVSVAALYICLVGQYMTLTELSLKASAYQTTIQECETEISKLKKASMTGVDETTMDRFIRANDMDKLARSDVEYLDLNQDEVIVNYENKKIESTAKKVFETVKTEIMAVIEFFL